MTAKKIGAALLLAFAGAVLASAGALAAERSVTLFYNWYGTAELDDISLAMVAEFEQAHPGVKVDLLRGGTVDGRSPTDRLLAAIAAGTPPDVVHFERSIVIEFAAKGLLQPLDRLLPGIAEQFLPGAMQEVIYKGEVYGVPATTDIRGLFWNKADFAAAGLDEERGPATIAELDVMAAKLTRTTGEGGFEKIGFVPWLGNWYAVGWLYTFGGDIYDAEQNRPRVNTPNHVRAMEWIQEYGQRYPYDVVASTIAGRRDVTFYDQRLAMVAHWNGHANLIRQADPNIDFWVGEVPHPEYGTNGTWLGGQAWVIPRAARNLEDGIALLNWMSSTEAEVALYRSLQRIPTRWSALQEIQDELSPTDAVLMTQAGVAWGRPPLWFPPFINRTNAAMTRVARLEEAPATALDEAQRLLELDFAEILSD